MVEAPVYKEAHAVKTPLHIKRSLVRQDGEYDYAIIDANNQIVAEAFGRTSETNFENAEENAHLFALAPALAQFLDDYLKGNEPACPCHLCVRARKLKECLTVGHFISEVA